MVSGLKLGFKTRSCSRVPINLFKSSFFSSSTSQFSMVQPLTPEQRNTILKALLVKGWALADGRDAIKKTFNFKDFNEAFGFMARVACKAEVFEHHPEWFNVYNKVDVVLSTHDVNGLSTKDIDMAEFMDSIKA